MLQLECRLIFGIMCKRAFHKPQRQVESDGWLWKGRLPVCNLIMSLYLRREESPQWASLHIAWVCIPYSLEILTRSQSGVLEKCLCNELWFWTWSLFVLGNCMWRRGSLKSQNVVLASAVCVVCVMGPLATEEEDVKSKSIYKVKRSGLRIMMHSELVQVCLIIS